MRPRIAVPTPTSFDPPYNRRCLPDYFFAIEQSGGVPIEIVLDQTPSAAANLINSCCAVCLPGSPADVNPQKYGHKPDFASAAPDSARENIDELLIQDAHNLYKPILGICFGAQLLNVWRGGTLIQDLTILPVNHAAAAGVAVAHTALVSPGSLLSSIVNREETPSPLSEATVLRLPVNSSHHQAIAIPGDGLRVSARCPQDRVVEAIEGGQYVPLSPDAAFNPHFVLGVQWHPERSFVQSPSSQAIFKRLVEEAAVWHPRTVRTSVAQT